MHYYCMRKRNTQWFGWIHHTFPLFADAADIDFVIGLVARSLSSATLLYLRLIIIHQSKYVSWAMIQLASSAPAIAE